MIRYVAIFIATLFIGSANIGITNAEIPAVSKLIAVTITGRIAREQIGKEQLLILHAKDGATYRIIGNLTNELVAVLENLGANNIVTVEGTLDGSEIRHCRTSKDIDIKEAKLTTHTVCNRIKNLTVTRIVQRQTSDEVMPEPTRDYALEAEERDRQALQNTPILDLGAVVQIYGTIKSVNIRAPIKFIEISYLDKDGAPITCNVMISEKTPIVKINPKNPKELITLGPHDLREGQKIAITYKFDGVSGTNSALHITVF